MVELIEARWRPPLPDRVVEDVGEVDAVVPEPGVVVGADDLLLDLAQGVDGLVETVTRQYIERTLGGKKADS